MPIDIDIIGNVSGESAIAGRLVRWEQVGNTLVSHGGDASAPSKVGVFAVNGVRTMFASTGFAAKHGHAIQRAAIRGSRANRDGDVATARAILLALEKRFGTTPEQVVIRNEGTAHLGEAEVPQENYYLDQDPREPKSVSYGSGSGMNYGLRITSIPMNKSTGPRQSPRMMKTTNRRGKLVPAVVPEDGSLSIGDPDGTLAVGNVSEDYPSDFIYQSQNQNQKTARRPVQFRVVEADPFAALPADGSVLGGLDATDYYLGAFGGIDDLGFDLFDKAKDVAGKVTGQVKEAAEAAAKADALAKQKVLDAAKYAGNAAKQAAANAAEAAAKGAKNAADAAKNAAGAAQDAAKNAAGAVTDAAKDTASRAADAARDAANAAKNAAESLKDRVVDAVVPDVIQDAPKNIANGLKYAAMGVIGIAGLSLVGFLYWLFVARKKNKQAALPPATATVVGALGA